MGKYEKNRKIGKKLENGGKQEYREINIGTFLATGILISIGTLKTIGH